MANLPSTFSYVTDVEVTQDGPLTEALYVKLGSNDNYLRDNLHAESATRISEDAAIRGAGPFQSRTTMKSRLDAANKVGDLEGSGNTAVGRIQEMSGLKFDVVAQYSWIHVTTDGGVYKVEKHEQTGNSGNISRSILWTGGEAVATTKFFDWAWQSTFANMFFNVRIFGTSSV